MVFYFLSHLFDLKTAVNHMYIFTQVGWGVFCLSRYKIDYSIVNLFRRTERRHLSMWRSNNLTASQFYMVWNHPSDFCFPCSRILSTFSHFCLWTSACSPFLGAKLSMEEELQGNFNVNRQKQRDSGGGCLRLRPRS